MSVRVTFYILDGQDQISADRFLCRLCEKICDQNERVYLACDEPTGKNLDQLLWAYEPESFLPHWSLFAPDSPGGTDSGVVRPTLPATALARVSILIGPDPARLDGRDVLINRLNRMPSHFSEAARVIEVLWQDQQVLQAGRQRFGQYRRQGIEPETHTIKAWY